MLGIVLKYLPLLQVAAVIVASGILSIGITRELFDMEVVIVAPPGLAPAKVTMLKYTTRQAAIARENFRLLTDAIYVLLTTLLVALFISVGIEASILALDFWGNTGRAAGQDSCFGHGFYRFLFCEFSTVARDAADQARRSINNEFTYPVGAIMFWLMMFGGVLIVGLGMAVRTVVDIRANHIMSYHHKGAT